MMLKRCGEKIGKLRRDDNGAAIIVVLVTMIFLVVLVCILLYSSLVNIQMKRMDKAGKANYYSAEASMDQIRAGVQSVVSESIEKAYSSVLITYTTKSPDAQTAAFKNSFLDGLTQTGNLLAKSGQAFTYSIATLADYAQSGGTKTEMPDGSYELTMPNGARIDIGGSGIAEDAGDGYVLKQIVVTYTFNGYQSSVTADIKIKVPELPYATNNTTQTAQEFAIIAKHSLQQPAGTGSVTVTGSTYASDLTVGGSGDTFSIRHANDFVLNGPATINGGSLTTDAGSPLWAQDITLNSNGRVTLAGDVYVSDDLNLLGDGTQATLSGRYFGYGNSPTDPTSSSAILVNGMNTLLDMTGLRSLLLAGSSYVDFGEGNNGYVMMGESVSVKSSQLAYLVPETCLTDKTQTNPVQYNSDDILPDPSNPGKNPNFIDFNLKFMNNKSLSDYGITNNSNLKVIRKIYGSTNLAYICLNFPDATSAGNYFKDYINYNSDKTRIQKFLALYSNGILLSSTATKNLAGDIVTVNGANFGYIGGTGLAADDKTVAGIKGNFNNLKVTLSRTTADSTGAASPYDYYINATDPEWDNLSGSKIYALNGVPKVLVIKNDGGSPYTIDNSVDSTIHLVIATGDVVVQRSFTGLILSGGAVTLLNSVTADSAAVSDALQALSHTDDNNNQTYTYFYLDSQHISPFTTIGSSNWNMSELVVFQNWVKNAA